MSDPKVITALGATDSPARTRPAERPPLRIGAVQERWHPDPEEHRRALAAGIRLAAAEGAELVCLQELTLSPYFAVDPGGPEAVGAEPEELPGGPTFEFAASAARENGVHVHASLFERADAGDGLGYNTAIVVSPEGELRVRTRKLHIPVTAGYHEDKFFRPGPANEDPSRCWSSAKRGSACRPAGTSGSRSWLAPTASGAPTSSSTRPRSAPSPTIPSSTPSRCGSA